MRILVVDDNADLRLLIVQVLSLAGHEVLEATGGMEALSILTDGPGAIPSAVVLDVQMPGMDGWETLRSIREKPATADLPVILCTVKGTAEDAALGWELGCDAYLTKPFEIGELLGEVAAVTSRSSEERAAVRDARLSGLLDGMTGHAQKATPEPRGEAGGPWTSGR